MPKTAVQHFLYKHPWPLVIEAYFRRYPTHPRLPVLLSTEVVEDVTDPVTKIRKIQRKCVVDVEAPMWLKRALRQYDFTFMQRTTIDPSKQCMHIVNTNVTYAGTIVLGDECEYKQDPDNPNWTIFEQQAEMQLPNFPFSKQCEGYMIKSYERNTSSGRNIDGSFIDDVVKEGWYARNLACVVPYAAPPDAPLPTATSPNLADTAAGGSMPRVPSSNSLTTTQRGNAKAPSTAPSERSRRRPDAQLSRIKKKTADARTYFEAHFSAITFFTAGLVTVAVLPQLVQIIPFGLIIDSLRSPAISSLLATVASLGSPVEKQFASLIEI